jgi:hypothetical protein
VSHQPADEVHVSAQSVELRHDHRALAAPRRGERAGEFRAAIQRVGTLARLDLGVLADDIETLGLGETSDRFPLRLDSQPGATLAGTADSVVCDGVRHRAPPSNACIYNTLTSVCNL